MHGLFRRLAHRGTAALLFLAACLFLRDALLCRLAHARNRRMRGTHGAEKLIDLRLVLEVAGFPAAALELHDQIRHAGEDALAGEAAADQM